MPPHANHYNFVSDAGAPTLSSLQYRDLTEVDNSPELGMIVCYSRGFPPTSVSWKRDNISFSVNDSVSYQQTQRVVGRATSLYSNILIFLDASELIGNHMYTCSVSNEVGGDSDVMELSNQGSTVCNFVLFCTLYIKYFALYSCQISFFHFLS